MPKPGFASITIRAQVKERLEEYARAKGYATLSDAINSLLDQATLCQAVTERLRELEVLQRKTYLAVLRLLEEHTGRTSGEEGPESPAGEAEGVKSEGTNGPVKSARSADPLKPLRRGREPQENIE